MEVIQLSVGKKGINQYRDVSTIQGLLNGCRHLLPTAVFLEEDGLIGPKTMGHIELFQKEVVKLHNPDGRVDPAGKTLNTLNMSLPKRNGLQVLFENSSLDFSRITRVFSNTSATYQFPLARRPAESYKQGMRRFGANRKSKGGRRRLHAGCDLYAPVGTPVYAMADGVVERTPYNFYSGTQAVAIRHKDFIALYGEIGSGTTAVQTVGNTIKQGEIIGYVGKLIGLNMSMLHLELYSGASRGAFTNTEQLPYMRRADLIDPTPILDKAVMR